MSDNLKINADEITSVLRRRLLEYGTAPISAETGTVLQVGDGIARVYGLRSAMVSELLEFPHGTMGMVLNLERDDVGCIILGDDKKIQEGDQVKGTGRIMRTSVGKALLGRVVNALGQPLDGEGLIPSDKTRPIESRAPSVIEREPVRIPLQTGIKAIDSMVPIGRGQRELIIGDRQTGKTAIAIDAIINQKNTDVVCVYVAIGQKNSTVARVVETLRENDAMDKTIVINAAAADPVSLQYIAPFVGCSMAEELMEAGKHVLIVYDDLSKHAVAYRQLSLLLRRPPGREAYPGDVFYLHARLLERAAKLSAEKGGGSITALPIVETQAGDISAYIPTNIISITDGQIYLESSLFNSGIRPAINPGLSVSRVGGNAQIKAMKSIAGRLRIELAQYRELSAFSQFSADLDKMTRALLACGERLMEILKQDQYHLLPVGRQIAILYAGVNGFIDDVPPSRILQFESELYSFMDRQYPELTDQLGENDKWNQELETKLQTMIGEFKLQFK